MACEVYFSALLSEAVAFLEHAGWADDSSPHGGFTRPLTGYFFPPSWGPGSFSPGAKRLKLSPARPNQRWFWTAPRNDSIISDRCRYISPTTPTVKKGITKKGAIIQARAASQSTWGPFDLYSVYHGAGFLNKRSFMDAAIELASTKLLG
jgi:hypothetical protein